MDDNIYYTDVNEDKRIYFDVQCGHEDSEVRVETIIELVVSNQITNKKVPARVAYKISCVKCGAEHQIVEEPK